ncbi:MAG: TonB-dependent receptor plug domain-containing protein [Pseudomonadota bacterium]
MSLQHRPDLALTRFLTCRMIATRAITSRAGIRRLVVGALLLWLPGLVGAQTPAIEEIIVTGELRELAIDDTSLSVTVIDPGDQRQTAINHLEEVLGWAPNVNFSSGASRGRFLQIRGIGERGQFAEPLNPSVGLLVDGVDLSGIGTVATTFDVKQIEIFRGPQGTLYGANALAGIVNVVTNDPERDFAASITADAANFGALGIGATVTGPLSEQLSGRLAVRQFGSDGFIDNTFLDVDDSNERDELTVRGKLLFEPQENTDVTVTLGYVDIDNGYDAFSLDNDRDTRSDEPGRDAQETIYGSIALDHRFASGLRLAGYVSHADSEIDYGYDEDWTFDGFDPIGYTSTDQYLRDRKTTSFDARLISQVTDRIDWIAGVFALTQDVELQRIYTFAPDDFFSDYGVDRVAAYGEVGVRVSDRLRVAGGLRLERLGIDYDDSLGVEFSPDETTLGGRVVAEFTLPSDNLLYGNVSRGYKQGGVNASGSLPAELRDFGTEETWNVEMGFKGRFAEGRGSLRVAAFVMLRDSVQTAQSLVIVRPDGSSEFIDYTDNAAEGTNYGLEIETSVSVNERLRLFGTLGLLSAEYDESPLNSPLDLDGRDQAQAPNYQFFAGVEYAPLPGWVGRLEFEGRDAFFFSDSHNERSRAYELINASISYRADNWYARLWARNLTDEDYFVRGFFFGNDPRDFYTARAFTQLGEPRRVGVTVGVDF